SSSSGSSRRRCRTSTSPSSARRVPPAARRLAARRRRAEANMKRGITVLLFVAVIGGGGAAYYIRSGQQDVPIPTAAVTRGDIVDTVGATGTLQAVTTVQVGSQVSGNISWLGADFNSIVHKGQVIARLDPSLFEAQLQQTKANLVQAQANHTKALSDL